MTPPRPRTKCRSSPSNTSRKWMTSSRGSARRSWRFSGGGILAAGVLMQEHIPDYAMIAAPPTEERFYARSDPLWVQRLALGLDLCTFYVVLLAAAAVL